MAGGKQDKRVVESAGARLWWICVMEEGGRVLCRSPGSVPGGRPPPTPEAPGGSWPQWVAHPGNPEPAANVQCGCHGGPVQALEGPLSAARCVRLLHPFPCASESGPSWKSLPQVVGRPRCSPLACSVSQQMVRPRPASYGGSSQLLANSP